MTLCDNFGCYVILIALTAMLVVYSLIELHYFLRMCLCLLLARFIKRKSHILDTTVVSGVCLTNDIDTLLYHMNNARYMRELDFARVDFYERTNLYRTIVAKGGSVFQGAATIRYRRFIRPFHRFKIASRIIFWDNQSVYMEHRFLRPSDNFVHAIAICKQRIITCSAEDVMNELLQKVRNPHQMGMANATVSLENGLDSTVTATTTTNLEDVENGHETSGKLKPDMPPEILKWIEYNDISSKNLRKGC